VLDVVGNEREQRFASDRRGSTDLAVVPIDYEVSSHALVGEAGRVRVIPTGESWPVRQVKSVLKDG
jgi:hypothetical protein